MQFKVLISDLYKGIQYPLEVEGTTRVEVVKLKISAAQNYNFNKIIVACAGNELSNSNDTMESLGIKENTRLIVDLKMIRRQNFADTQQEASYLVDKCQIDSAFVEDLLQKQPQLAEAILNENMLEIVKLLNKAKVQQNWGGQFGQMQQGNYNQGLQYGQMQQDYRGQGMNMQMGNQFDPNYQKKLEAQIQAERLNKLQAETYENYPELFVPTEMLFISGRVNNVDLEIFVDTGAQTTVISKKFAEKANIFKNVDKRYAGKVVGVGQTTSLGRIWQIPLEIEGRYFVMSAVVLDKFSHEVLLGLDMMKRHRCVIDLVNHNLVFSLENVSTKFKTDHEVSMIRKKEYKEQIEYITKRLKVSEDQAQKLFFQFGMDEEEAVLQGKKLGL